MEKGISKIGKTNDTMNKGKMPAKKTFNLQNGGKLKAKRNCLCSGTTDVDRMTRR